MLKNYKSSRRTLLTLPFLGLAFALSLSVADAAKPSPAPNVKYKMKVSANLPRPADDPANEKYYKFTLLGMNNFGQVLVVGFVDDGGTVFVWDTDADVWVDLGQTLFNAPDLQVVPSAALSAARGDRDWSEAIKPFFVPEYTHAINDWGEVAGSFWIVYADGSLGPSHACRCTPRTIEPPTLIDLGVPDSKGLAINNNGDVAGYVYDSGTECPYLWTIDPVSLTVTPLQFAPGPGLWGTTSRAVDINDNFEGRQVTGMEHVTTGRAFRYTLPPADDYEDLGVLRGGGWSWGLAINNWGDVAGECTTSTGSEHAILYTDRMIDLGTLGSASLSSIAWDINDKCQLVGWAYSSWNARSIFLYTPATRMYDVWKLIDTDTLPPGATASNISFGYGSIPFINDRVNKNFGEICCCITVNSVNNGVQAPFILKPNN